MKQDSDAHNLEGRTQLTEIMPFDEKLSLFKVKFMSIQISKFSLHAHLCVGSFTREVFTEPMMNASIYRSKVTHGQSHVQCNICPRNHYT